MDFNILNSLGPGEHACCFFRQAAEVAAAATTAIRVLPGPAIHFFFADGEPNELPSAGFQGLADRKLVLFPEPLGKGPPVEAIVRRIDDWLSRHPQPPRIHLDLMLTGPALTYPAAEWFHHLGALDSYLHAKNCSCMSFYREAAFAPGFVFQCLRVHPLVIVEGLAVPNPVPIPAVSLAAALEGRADEEIRAGRAAASPAPIRPLDNWPADTGACRDLVTMLPTPFFLIDAGGFIRFANTAAAAMLPQSDPAGLPYARLVHPADRPRAQQWLTQIMAGTRAGPQEIRVGSRQGTARVRCHGAGLPRGGQVVWQDLTLREKLEVSTMLNRRLGETCAELQERTVRDVLTGLYNRKYFEEEVHRFRNPRQWPVSALLVDVDGLKKINDAYGHARGDQALRAAAEAIKAPFREGDVVARIGGDEFAVVLPQTDYATACARRREITAAAAAIDRREGMRLSLSIGVATSEGPEPDVKKLINMADMDMYRVKNFSERKDGGGNPPPLS